MIHKKFQECIYIEEHLSLVLVSNIGLFLCSSMQIQAFTVSVALTKREVHRTVGQARKLL